MILSSSCLLEHSGPISQTASQAIESAAGPLVIPTPILSEIAYMIESRQGAMALVPFLEDVHLGAYQRDCCESELGRTIELLKRYADMSLGFADATVMACAERRNSPVLTFDLRHFPIVAREGTFRIVEFD